MIARETPATTKPRKAKPRPQKAPADTALNKEGKPEKAQKKAPARILLTIRRREATDARFIFYPGQKGTIIERIAALIPKDATRLIEPFTGSGSVPAALAFRFREIQCSDALPAVIEAHRRAIANPDGFCADIKALFDDPASDPKAYFIKLRDRYNAKSTPLAAKAALLIYLNRKAALGLVRHNEAGDFSGSWHESKVGNPPPLAAIRRFAKRLGGKAQFAVQDFRAALTQAGPGDFVYCDPPYLPEEGEEITFTGYSEAFGIGDHVDLAALARAAADRGAKVVVSNHDSAFIRQTYASADSFTDLAVERKAGRKKGQKAKTTAREILAVWRPRKPAASPKLRTDACLVLSPGKMLPAWRHVPTSGMKRLRREAAIDPYNPHADQPTLDLRVYELAAKNGWLKNGADQDRISFRSFNESGRYLLKIARLGTPSMRRLVLDRPGREACVSLHLLAKIIDALKAGRAAHGDAERGARSLLALADGLEKFLAAVAGGDRLVTRALKLKAAVFLDMRLETARLPERYAAVLGTVAEHRWKPGSEAEHRLLLLAEMCPDADTGDFRKLCRKIAAAPGPSSFLGAVPALKAGSSHGIPLEAHAVLPAGSVAELIGKI